MGAAIAGVLVVCLTVAASILGMHLVRRRVTHTVLQENNEVAGYIVGVLGMVYAVLLAFVVVVVWELWRDADERVENEANQLSSLLLIADTLPEDARDRVHRTLERYVRGVVDEEWALMARGETSPRAREAYHELWSVAAASLALAGPQQVECFAQYLDLLEELGDARRLRLVSNQARLPAVIWVLLVFGAALNIGFTFLFGARNARHQAVMIAALAAMIGSTLFLIGILEHPYQGLAAVGPEVFDVILQR